MAVPPTVVTAAGLQPQTPQALNAQLLALVAATNPGYTATLPGSLIEDIASTDTGAIVQCDAARVEVVNSLTPYGANEFLLTQLGAMLGIEPGLASNTSVLVQFSGTPGQVIAQGFLVSDGSHQYRIVSGGIINSEGVSALLFAVATAAGTWAVPENSVTTLVTAVPSVVTLTVTNPNAGVPGSEGESISSYRLRVVQANLAASQGMSRFLKTLLGQVNGVQPRLVSVQQRDDGKWMVIVGGGDPYEVAYAIYMALFDINNIVGSLLIISEITNANPGVVTTFLNHGLSAGTDITITDSDPSDYDGSYAVLAVPSEKEFSLGKRFSARNITDASWLSDVATIETSGSHGITVGTTVVITGVNPAGYNGTRVVTVVGAANEFSFASVVDPGTYVSGGSIAAGIAFFDTTGLPAYVNSAIVLPNNRNVLVTVNDYPDSYQIPYVNPPRQVVTMTVTWNTTAPNVVSDAAISQLGAPALADYVNAIYVGQPMNLIQMADVFKTAIATALPEDLLTRLVFAVSINGVGTIPASGEEIIEGDPESYFEADSSGISVVRG